jgi:CarD family transcriptional regulator
MATKTARTKTPSKTVKRTTKAPAKAKSAPRKAATRKAATRKAPAPKKVAAVKKAPVKKAAVKKAAVRKTAAKKAAVRKTAAKKAAPAKKAVAKRTAPKKAQPKKTAAAAKPAAKKASPAKAPARPAAAKKAPAGKNPVAGKPEAPKTPPPKKLGGFACGDYVVYPTHGVGKISTIEDQEVAGYQLRLFVVRFEKEKMTLRIPVDKADEAGLRKLSSRQQIDVAIETLKGRSRVNRAMWSRRAQEYEAKINSGDPVSIAEVVRDLHRNAGQPDQSYSERQIYEAALERLSREVAAVDKIDREAATLKLEGILETAA